MITCETMVCRWQSSDRPLFKGSLISSDGCCCAQGDVLRLSGKTDNELRSMKQYEADKEVAKILGISITHSVLLRQINDSREGSPQDVLANPEKILGEHAGLILEFWWHLDVMTPAAWAAPWAAAGAAATPAAWDAAWAAAGDAAWAAAENPAFGAAAGAAAWEVQGHVKLDSDFYFLPLFGLTIDQLKEMHAKRKGGK